MPVIRCPKCGQAYDVPGVVAVRLPNAIATCHCGEWLSGSKAAVLARMLDPAKIKEIDLQPYRIDNATADAKDSGAPAVSESGGGNPRSIRIVALGAEQALDATFTIDRYALVIGTDGAHIEFPDAGLAPRHCSILVRGDEIVLRAGKSEAGTLLDGKRIDEAVINDGVHLLQIGSVRLAVEPTEESGTPVGPLPHQAEEEAAAAAAAPSRGEEDFPAVRPEPPPFFTEEPDEPEPPPVPAPPPAAVTPQPPAGIRPFLVCIDGPLNGQEFEVPPTGLTVGREGHVRVPDEFLSRKHFQVMPDADSVVRVKDLGSRNGTFLNAEPAKDTVVTPNDEIRAGVNRFRIEHRS